MNERELTNKIVASILLMVVISRALLFFTGYFSINTFSSFTEPAIYENTPASVTGTAMKLPIKLTETQWLTLGDLAKFDSYNYFRIVEDGYDRISIYEPHPPANWVFFPLYPLLVYGAGKLTSLITYIDSVILGVVLSNLLLFAGLIYVHLFCRRLGLTVNQARSVVLLLLLYPTSIYFSLPYTESLFLLLSAASLYYATSRQYALAFIAASLSTVTRVPGFLNLFFVLGSILFNEGFRLTRAHLRWALYSLLSLAPIAAFLLYMKQLSGDYLAPFHEQSLNWYRFTAVPFENYVWYIIKPYFFAPGAWDNGLLSFIVSTVVLLVFIIYLARQWKTLLREPRSLLLFIYGGLLIAVPFASQPWYLSSVIRYMMVCIPFFVYLVRLTSNKQNALLFVQMLFFTLNVIIVIGFFNKYQFMA